MIRRGSHTWDVVRKTGRSGGVGGRGLVPHCSRTDQDHPAIVFAVATHPTRRVLVVTRNVSEWCWASSSMVALNLKVHQRLRSVQTTFICRSSRNSFGVFPSDAHKDSSTLYEVLAESDFNSSAGVPPKPGELVRAAPLLLRTLQTQPIRWFYFKS